MSYVTGYKSFGFPIIGEFLFPVMKRLERKRLNLVKFTTVPEGYN